MFICKAWQAPATQAFYTKLELSAKNLLHIHLALRDDRETFSVAKWVKVLRIHHECAIRRTDQNIVTRLEPEGFLALLSQLRNLTQSISNPA